MHPIWMPIRVLIKFSRCLVNNGNGTFSLSATSGSSSGSNYSSSKKSEVMDSFSKTISNNAVRVV